MAQSLGRLHISSLLPTVERSPRAVSTLRLTLGWFTLLGAIVFLLATCLDVQWHASVGRDRTLTLPHLLMLGGVTLSGITALTAVLIETTWTRANPALRKISTHFNGTFSSSLGAYIAGFAALDAAISFPLDSYWHSIYGVDVSIWAPFHVMFISSMSIVAGGAAYMLISAAHLAIGEGRLRAGRAGYVGVIVALATLAALLMLFAIPGRGENGYLHLGVVTIGLFPPLLTIFGAFVLVAVVYAVPWRLAATSVATVYLFFGLLAFLLVPPAMNILLVLEQQTLRLNAPKGNTAETWAITLIVAALIIDLAAWFMRRKKQSSSVIWTVICLSALVGCVLMATVDPLFLLSVLHQPQAAATLGVSVALGGIGACVGSRFGRMMGESLYQLER